MDKLRAKRWGEELSKFRDEWERRDSTNGAVLEMIARLNSWCHANSMSHEQCVGSILNWVLPSKMKTQVLHKLQRAVLYYPKIVTVGGEEFVPVWGTLEYKFLISGSEKRGTPGWLPVSSFRSACDPSSWDRLSLEPIAPGSPVDQAVSDVWHNSFRRASFLASSHGSPSFVYTPRKTPERALVPGSASSSSGSGGGGGSGGEADQSGPGQTVMPQLPEDDSVWAVPPGEQQFKFTLIHIFES